MLGSLSYACGGKGRCSIKLARSGKGSASKNVRGKYSIQSKKWRCYFHYYTMCYFDTPRCITLGSSFVLQGVCEFARSAWVVLHGETNIHKPRWATVIFSEIPIECQLSSLNYTLP